MNANPTSRGVYGDSSREDKQAAFPVKPERVEKHRSKRTDEARFGLHREMNVERVESTGEWLACGYRTAESELGRAMRPRQGLCRTFIRGMMWLPYGHLIIDRDMSPVQDLKRGHQSYLGPQGLASYIHGKSQHTALDSERNYHCNRLAEQLITTAGGDA